MSPKELGPKKDYAGEDQQHIQKKNPSSRQRGRPTKQDRNCQKAIQIWSWAPDRARHQDLLTDWPSVTMWLWLWLRVSQFSVGDSHGKFVVEEELGVGLWGLNVWFEDVIFVVVQWYLEYDSYSSCVKSRCQETDKENFAEEEPLFRSVI
jgi:hypothetical protein